MKLNEKEAKELRAKILKGGVSRWEIRYDEGTYDLGQASLGYFGEYAIISVGGLKTIVECDPRDRVVIPVIDWYDDIKWISYHNWSRDRRFVSRPNSYPAIVKKDGKYAMIGYYGEKDEQGLIKPYYGRWYDEISNRERSFSLDAGHGGYVIVLDAKRDGHSVLLTCEGQELDVDVNLTLAKVKEYTKEDIIHKWIEAGNPCTLIYGFRFKGATSKPISKEEALKRVQSHSFGKDYYSMEWTVTGGRVVLEFQEYSEGDMT